MNTNQKSLRWILLAAVAILCFAVLGFIALIWIDKLPLEAATPPENMETLEEFRDWKGDEIFRRKYTYKDVQSGQRFDVCLAPSGRVLASGPSAYVFDKDGNFVDWTPDLGDFSTRKYRYDLSLENLDRVN